jgi:hypothetical protein
MENRNPSSDRLKSSSEKIDAIASISAILSGLSNREAREVITMVSSVRNLRVVSMDRPIGRPTPMEEKPNKAKKANKPSPWKKNPEWVAAVAARSTIVERLKANPGNSQAILADLRKQESAMKDLKRQLLGFHQE